MRNEKSRTTSAQAFWLTVGRNLELARRVAGIQLSDLEIDSEGAWRAGTVRAWERGDRRVTCEKAEVLAQIYGFKLVDLLPGSDEALRLAAKTKGIDLYV